MMDLAELLTRDTADSQETQIVELDIPLCPVEGVEQAMRCRSLVAALLKNLILDLVGEGVVGHDTHTEDRQRLAKAQGEAYVFSDEDRPFSFVWVCELLGLSPENFRRGVRSGEHFLWAQGIKTAGRVHFLQTANPISEGAR